ncbi:uncharacterized protein LOC123317457 [Coccinella septempunctata]|uniref:uncharacterized protein LOC123317457 n=1 Tax=Coccinella septempunctata TaxID=41139 RepID=UPI001D0940C2|nr:uncharacterized protein LOC123317457 [Coccinella septempunctata]
MSGIIIRRKSFPTYSSVKCEFSPSSTKYLGIDTVKKHKFPYPLPQIAIKKTKDGQIVDGLQIALFNGSWDTSEGIPSIVAEMHGAPNWTLEGEKGKNEESSTDGDHGSDSFSWLLNYKFTNLIPTPGIKQ